MSEPFHLLPYFDDLDETKFEETSLADPRYNCIAWAANDNSRWWWPDEDSYWPDSAPREHTVEAFVKAYESLGYKQCPDGRAEQSIEKIAIYSDKSGPQHAARQLQDSRWHGEWTSKLGPYEDIRHIDLDCICGRLYGTVIIYMSRGMPD